MMYTDISAQTHVHTLKIFGHDHCHQGLKTWILNKFHKATAVDATATSNVVMIKALTRTLYSGLW